MRKLRWAAALLTVGILVALGVLVAGTLGADPASYDSNRSSYIESDEAVEAVRDYFDGEITQDEAVDNFLRHFAAVPLSPTPRFPVPTLRPQPTATPRPTATTTTPARSSPVPTATPVPVLVAPTITHTMANTSALQIDWSYPDALKPLVTGYEVKFSGAEQQTTRTTGRGASGISTGCRCPIGAEFTLQVRAISHSGPGLWASKTRTIPAPLPTRTPTPFVPTPEPTPMSNAYDNGCWEREELDRKDPSDIRMAAMFRNAPRPEKEPWEAPKTQAFRYGFILRNVETVTRDAHGSGPGLVAYVGSNGRWYVRVASEGVNARHHTGDPAERWRPLRVGPGGVIISSGDLAEAGVPFDLEPEALNHMMFSVKGDEYRFVVNGQDVPLDIGAEELEKIDDVVGRYYYHDTGLWHGYYNFFRWVPSEGWLERYGSREPLEGAWGRSTVTGYANTDIGIYTYLEENWESKMVSIISQLPRAACKP